MPRLSFYLIRTALLHLAVGFTIGALLLFNKGVPLTPDLWRLLPGHVEVVLVGWTIQLVLGVAFWILPRFSEGPARGDERLVWAAYGLLNAGVVAVLLSPWLLWPGEFLLAGRLAELGAVACFAVNAWPRVKAFRE